MIQSRPFQFVGFVLLTLAVAGFVLTQIFQCSMTTSLVSVDPRDFFDPAAHPLMDIIYNDGSVEEVEALLEENPEWVTQPIYFGWYAVHCAGQAGRPDVLQVLIDHGADIHAVGPGGGNVIVSAFESEDPETLAFVLDAGVDPHLKLPDGTPLEYIRDYGSPKLNRVLDERGLPGKSP